MTTVPLLGSDRRPDTGPVVWVPDPDDYAGASAGIPVLLPASPRKALLWREVVRTQFDGVHPPLPGARLVLALGASTWAAARVHARFSGSRLVRCDAADEIDSAIASAAEPNIVLLAMDERLTVALLARVSAACRAVGKAVGFLCGRDEAGLSFAVAKSLLRPRSDLSGVDVFDAPLHRQEDNAKRLPAGFEAMLTRPSLAKVLRSHGEGGHAKLPGVVACGLLDETEFPDDPHAGCAREPRRCKRAKAVDSSVVFGDELAAAVVCFVCCNGFNVAGELYPTQVSMALAFAEGWAGAVIAPIRPLIAPDDMVEALDRGLTGGERLGSIVARLNGMSAGIGQPDAFVLHGDPCLALAASGPPPPAPAQGDDPRLADLRDWLVRVLRQCERGRRTLRSSAAWLGDRGEPLLAPLRTQFDQVERLTLNALKWAEINPAGERLRRLAHQTTLIRLAVARWDRLVSRLLLEVRDTLDAFDIGHYDQVPVEIRDGTHCARCGTPTEVHVYGRGEPDDARRLAVLCLVCGPVSEHRAEGLGVVVTRIPKTGAGGEEFLLRAELRVPDGVSALVHGVQVYLRFFDKANDRCVHEEARTVAAEDQVVEFGFVLPDDLGVDLHSIRLVVASGFDIGYARARFAGLPARLLEGP
jgi:hypothetical protein